MQSIKRYLLSPPTYTISFLPHMPLRLPPPMPKMHFHSSKSLSPLLKLLPDKVVAVAISLLAVMVGIGAARSRYRVRRMLHNNVTPTPGFSCSEEKDAQSVPDSYPLRIPVPTKNPLQPFQLLTPPATPPRTIQPVCTSSPAPPEQYACSHTTVPSTSTAFNSSGHPSFRDHSGPSQSSFAARASAPRVEIKVDTSRDRASPSFSNPLPSDVAYSNTSYATLLQARKLLIFEQKRRATLEAEARAELNALLKVYWGGVRARAWNKKRRSDRRMMFGLAGGNEGAEMENADDETERREEENTKESLRSLQGKVLAMRKERVPYEDVLCPSPSPKAYILEDGKLSTIPSARISPSQFISVLSDPTITSNLREIDVALGLWEDWGWDVEEEWSFEVRSRRRDLYAAPDRDEDLVAYVQRQLDLPILKRLSISTLDVPVGVDTLHRRRRWG
ncbi:hypothetical protein NMY22_g2447 [Coprinellus aureogranulatus]|nr:hypothetical protein NMY22_g2447 [Coprinellus aureogranulatus]